MATGFVTLAAARSAADGADVDTVAAAASAAVGRSHGYIVVHRLDNLRRSGRIDSAAAWLGTALSLKPLLRIDDGKLVLAQRIRTASKSVAAMIDRVSDIVGDRAAALAVHHVANPDGADQVAAALAERLPACEPADRHRPGSGAGAARRWRSAGGVRPTCPTSAQTAARPVIGGRSASVTMPGSAATTAGTALVTGIAV
ncbi:DegV domain-containing protein [Mycobacterium talmoniae]|uniref:DegV domain-containing protein n=1 Tax=Mycobacterium talmoniae TaxID=1858794 RepID=A0A2S8BM59_9MYCO|nr:DegV domain-containing protein [Mycobacterium talmoniae]